MQYQLSTDNNGYSNTKYSLPPESSHAKSIGISLCRVSPDSKVDYVETVT